MPLLPPGPATASLPVRGSARENSNHLVQMAPGPNGELYVLIPARQAPATLALLGVDGKPMAGWPIVVPHATSCDQVFAVGDGSVRVICTMENPDGNMFDPIAAFAFDANGRLRLGWPVAIPAFFATGRVINDDLALLTIVPLGDLIEEGQPTSEVGLVTIGAYGAVSSGTRVPVDWRCCRDWAVSPDGIAYGTDSIDGSSSMVAVDATGIRAGWPITFDDAISRASFRVDGRAAVVLASLVRNESRVVVLDRDAKVTMTAAIPMQTAVYSQDTGGCAVTAPQAPVVAEDGSIIVYSELAIDFYAVDASPAIMPGWPFPSLVGLDTARPGLESEHEAGYCPAPVPPAVAPDSTLYLARTEPTASVGGNLVAVGRDGRILAGWPVELKRPGSEFWSVVVGPFGTYALPIEPESGGKSSATILALAADSSVTWSTTIIDP
jgi:hypothetical protein